MSQNTTEKTAGAAAAGKKLLCKTFTESNISAYIDPQWLFLQLQTSGILYQPQTPMSLQARAIIIEDIKLFIANYFKTNGVDIETDEQAAKQINTWFESAIIKTSPYIAVQSGAVSQERVQEILAGSFGFSPFGQMGGFGGQMGGMGMGMQMPGMGMGFGMPGFGGGMNPFANAMPAWNKKSDSTQQKTQQPFNPMMMMGMGGQMPGMGIGFGMPGMGMGFPGMMGGI